jgi:hypothetical protein
MKFKDIINEEMDEFRKKILAKRIEIKKIRKENSDNPYNDSQRNNNEKRIDKLEDDIFDLMLQSDIQKGNIKNKK